MEEQIYQMQAAGHVLRFRLRSTDTLRFFRGYLEPAGGGQQYDVCVNDDLLALGKAHMEGRSDGYVEAKMLIALTSQSLLRYRACMFHAVAFAWRGRAWLLTGRSGVGKSTQYRQWKALYGPEIEMICGDMPILEQEPDGTVRVHPSAWNGKECWSGQVSAPLGGIVFLKQADENAMTPVETRFSAVPVLRELMCVPDTEQETRVLAGLADAIVSNYPVWVLHNRGDEDSTRLTRRTLEAYLSERSGK